MPPVFLLDEMSIERLSVSAKVMGTGTVMRIRGKAAMLVEPGKASAEMNIQTVDEDANILIGFYLEPGSISLASLHAAIAGLLLDVDLNNGSENNLFDGSCQISIEDASRLGRLIGIDASGSLSLQTDLFSIDDRQYFSGTAVAHDFQFNDFLLKKLDWQAQKEDRETLSSLKAEGTKGGTPWRIENKTACNLTASNGLFRADSMETQIGEFIMTLRAPATLWISKNRIALNDFILDWMGGTLSADIDLPGKLTLFPFSINPAQNEKMKFFLSSNTDLSELNALPFFPNQNFGGQIEFQLDYEGTMTDGILAGHCAVENGRFEHYEYGTVVRDINFDMVTDGHRLVLNEITATDGDQGKLRADGQIAFVPNKGFPFNFSVTFDKTRIARNDFLDVTISGEVSLTGSINEMALAGDLKIDPAYVYLDKLPAQLPETLDEAPLDAEKNNTGGVRHDRVPLTADISLNIPGGFFIQGRGIDTVWGGNLHLADSSEGWVVTGQVSPRRGTFTFLSRPFRFDQGTVTFDGSIPPMPVLDLSALYSRADIVARLKFEGRLNKPELSLQSDPPLPEDEVLARILFGKNMSTITPLQAVQVASAAHSMVSPGSGNFNLMGEIKNLLGVDQLEFREGGDTEGKTELVAGKHVSNQLYVEVNKALNSDESKISAEYEIYPNFSIETYTGTGLRPGIGINWKKDY